MANALLRTDEHQSCAAPPGGETVVLAGSGLIRFTEPSGISGSFGLDPSTYGAVGLISYSLSLGGTGYAELRACSLPPSDARLCEAILTTNVQVP